MAALLEHEYIGFLHKLVQDSMAREVGDTLETIIAEARQKAADEVEAAVRKQAAQIAMRAMSHYNFERAHDHLIITVKIDKDGK